MKYSVLRLGIPGCSYIETEQNNIAILHDILFTFASDQTSVLCGTHRTGLYQLVKGNNFRSDKASFYIGVDFGLQPAALWYLL